MRTGPLDIAGAASQRFSPIGIGCVLVLAATASYQGSVLVGSVPGLVGTAYGRMALTKLALFTILLSFAAINRFWLTPAVRKKGTQERDGP